MGERQSPVPDPRKSGGMIDTYPAPAVPDPTVKALSEADSNDPVWPHTGDPIDRWECDGCGAVVADCGGDEMLGWSGTEAGWFCPRCAQGELGEPPQAVKNRLHMMKGPHNNAKGILAALAARAAAPDALRVVVEALSEAEWETRMARISPDAAVIAEDVWTDDEPTLAEYELTERILAARAAAPDAHAAVWKAATTAIDSVYGTDDRHGYMAKCIADKAIHGTPLPWDYDTAAPDALRVRIEALHHPEPVYWDAFDCPVPDAHAPNHVEGRYTNDDICTACPPLRQTCSTCVEYGEHGPEPMNYPCPTLRALLEDGAQ